MKMEASCGLDCFLAKIRDVHRHSFSMFLTVDDMAEVSASIMSNQNCVCVYVYIIIYIYVYCHIYPKF